MHLLHVPIIANGGIDSETNEHSQNQHIGGCALSRSQSNADCKTQQSKKTNYGNDDGYACRQVNKGRIVQQRFFVGFGRRRERRGCDGELW
mmetsp:Transcript_52140/g.83090  ORF Transcript_52140/g.83090 Transcript_52140/m.83090 type:complete len:91 (+) Transcript_52140:232-504(+)